MNKFKIITGKSKTVAKKELIELLEIPGITKYKIWKNTGVNIATMDSLLKGGNITFDQIIKIGSYADKIL